MKSFFTNFCLLAFLSGILFSCSPQGSSTLRSSNNTFEANFKGEGTGFYKIDKKGQLSYMLDFGDQVGVWSDYGNAYRENGASPLHFKAVERNVGQTSFYILDGQSGQLSYMSDFGDQAGEWLNFGDQLKNANITNFDAEITDTGGMYFFAYDATSKKTYFMKDYGGQAGFWFAVGSGM